MDEEKAKTLLSYVKSNPPKHGPTKEEPMGSGPGGAGATNRLVSRQMAKIAKSPSGNMPGSKAQRNQFKADEEDYKKEKSINQMKQVIDIYNRAANTIRKSKKNNRDI